MRRHALAAEARLQRGVRAGPGSSPVLGVTKAAIGQTTRVKRLPPHLTECYTQVVDMAKKNAPPFIPVKG
jgi:hypothetical protein